MADDFAPAAAGNGAAPSPTYAPPQPSGLKPTLRRNIDTLQARRREEQARAGIQEKIADRFTRFAGSMTFAYLHLTVFGSWILCNVGWVPGVRPWDPTFVVLGMVASVEAIFLSTFVLISQNRMAAAADKRADLDLQINLLSEHEVTKLVQLVTRIAATMDVEPDADPELAEIRQDVAPEAVLDEIEATAPQGSRGR